MTLFLALNQFVNTWECDENDHLNVQFYYSKFDDAADLFATIYDLEEKLGTRQSRLVRYHSELRSSEQIRILSSLVRDEDGVLTNLAKAPAGGQWVQHIMIEVHTGRLAATALDYHHGSLDLSQWEGLVDELDHRVKPRSLQHAPDMATVTQEERSAQGYEMTTRGVLHPAMSNAAGIARDQAFIGAVSDAASHAWELVGLTGGYLRDHGLGRVAVEMRLVTHKAMKVGTVYELKTGFVAVNKRSFSKRYDFFDLKSGDLLGFVEATAMILNHTTRRSEPLPDFAREAIEKRVGQA